MPPFIGIVVADDPTLRRLARAGGRSDAEDV
jgi:hypothetical protein